MAYVQAEPMPPLHVSGAQRLSAVAESGDSPGGEAAYFRSDDGSWLARLELNFRRLGTRTVVDRAMSFGPLAVQRPFREPDGGCQVYLLHPPGGLVAGDRLNVGVRLGDRSQGLLTAPGATKVSRSGQGGWAGTHLSARLEGCALLEWLPPETIVFEGARLSQSCSVELGATGQFLGWEVLCLGRHSGSVGQGRFRQRWDLSREGKPLWSEVNDLRGGDPVFSEPWGLGGASVMGTLVATGAGRDSLEALRQLLASAAARASVTLLGEVMVVRLLGDHSEVARRLFEPVWALLRSSLYGRQVLSPRVWAT